jgi:PTS system nitrogen regulatory IIA component
MPLHHARRDSSWLFCSAAWPVAEIRLPTATDMELLRWLCENPARYICVRRGKLRVALLNIKQLPLDRILLGQRISSEQALFSVVAEALAGDDTLMSERIRNRLARRQSRRSVGLGAGLALPHAAIPALPATRAVFVRSLIPSPMSAPDEAGITDVLALVVAPPGLAADYDLLMSLPALFLCADHRAALQRARSPAEIQALLSREA